MPRSLSGPVGKNSYNEDVYSVTVNTNAYDSVIFNGSGGQTRDIRIADAVAGGCGIYCLDNTSGSGLDVAFYEYKGLDGGDTDPTQAPTEPQPSVNKLYLDPGTTWPQDGARYAAYFFAGDSNTWVDVKKEGDTYSVTVPDGYTNVIFCRMNPATTENNWQNNTKWNQTADLTISGNIGKTYHITGWDNSGYWG